jgi:hypothetical protein
MKPITDDAGKKRREAAELACGTRFLLDLRESLDEARVRGIPLAAAKRRLDARLAAEGLQRPARKSGPRRPPAR